MRPHHLRHLLSILGLAVPALALAQQAVVVDDAHLQMQRAGKPPAQMYEVKPAPALLLDARNYKFDMPAQLAGKPGNSVQIVVAKDRNYAAPWDPLKSVQLLSKETLKPNAGSLPFAGFSAGQQLVLAIGNQEGANFNVVWVGMASVR